MLCLLVAVPRKVFFSLELLGNPVGLFTDIGEGVYDTLGILDRV